LSLTVSLTKKYQVLASLGSACWWGLRRNRKGKWMR